MISNKHIWAGLIGCLGLFGGWASRGGNLPGSLLDPVPLPTDFATKEAGFHAAQEALHGDLQDYTLSLMATDAATRRNLIQEWHERNATALEAQAALDRELEALETAAGLTPKLTVLEAFDLSRPVSGADAETKARSRRWTLQREVVDLIQGHSDNPEELRRLLAEHGERTGPEGPPLERKTWAAAILPLPGGGNMWKACSSKLLWMLRPTSAGCSNFETF